MKIYFLGISGTIMGNLAQIARALGHEVTGCDAKVYPPMSVELKSSGINFSEGYIAKNYDSADLYVVGNTISRGNEILENVLKNEDKIISGPDWLYKNVLKNNCTFIEIKHYEKDKLLKTETYPLTHFLEGFENEFKRIRYN